MRETVPAMSQIELTPAEMTRLTEELQELEGPRREDAVAAIATARGFGDLSENFEYHAAKNEQGLLERQIVILRAKIAAARVVDGARRGGSRPHRQPGHARRRDRR